ncbi:hypothetical protein [Solibacillus isronensis]|uniref:hypothetical protein n=1 Tax=Solibacillus isronensis TaxID=412383 RepID=UPI001591615C|nr:hypothetical protein [Solibacillus isronensis]
MSTLILALVSFNLYFSNKDTQETNKRLEEQVARLEMDAGETEEIYSETEAFLDALFEGEALDYFTESYRIEVEDEMTDEESMYEDNQNNTEELEVFNISVRPQEEGYKVYAIYRVTLTGVGEEQQRVMYLMSQIEWVQEDGWKVDSHDLEPLVSGDSIEQAIGTE